jgi:hypothetical protein
MGVASKAVSVTLRALQLISAAIVAGILGRFLHLVHSGHGHFNNRLVYAITLAGLSIFFSLCLILPLLSFLAFPLDLIMFILWMVAFGLMEGVSASRFQMPANARS